jgi:hypothetical protein
MLIDNLTDESILKREETPYTNGVVSAYFLVGAS